jgi:hypothetical protein
MHKTSTSWRVHLKPARAHASHCHPSLFARAVSLARWRLTGFVAGDHLLLAGDARGIVTVGRVRGLENVCSLGLESVLFGTRMLSR